MYEAELIQIYDEVFAALGIEVTIKFNNRKILAGIAEAAGITENFMDMTIAIDKLDKMGPEGIRKEMLQRGISNEAVDRVNAILETKSLNGLKAIFSETEMGSKGVEEIEQVMQYLNTDAAKNDVKFDITLARGLSYYTGCIFEVSAKNVKMGSIGGGGRYDDLTGIFGLKNVSGVGISFGAERIYDVMEELNLFPKKDAAALKVLLIAFDEETHRYAFKTLGDLRAIGINADLYPEPAKMKKQMKYANSRNVPYTIIIGSQEMETGLLTLKNMTEGTQEKLLIEEIVRQLS
jgi:histidyl-tRNA synthetase